MSEENLKKIQVALYGNNGHQIQKQLLDNPRTCLIAIGSINPENLRDPNQKKTEILHQNYSLDEILNNDQVDLISFCSPMRSEQAAQCIRAMECGKHVYAEKPCAMNERDLDSLIETSNRTGQQFHEMAGTAFENPYFSMRELIAAGKIGEVVQVLAQKSYPYRDTRPADENVDGGLILQVGVHGLRYIEHVAGVRVSDIQACETSQGNPRKDNLKMAAAFMMKLENGGVASLTANYLNQRGFGQWGNEHLRIWGTKGFVEATDGGVNTRLVIGEEDCGPLNLLNQSKKYFETFLDFLIDEKPMPLTLEDELHPTRMVMRARESAKGLIIK